MNDKWGNYIDVEKLLSEYGNHITCKVLCKVIAPNTDLDTFGIYDIIRMYGALTMILVEKGKSVEIPYVGTVRPAEAWANLAGKGCGSRKEGYDNLVRRFKLDTSPTARLFLNQNLDWYLGSHRSVFRLHTLAERFRKLMYMLDDNILQNVGPSPERVKAACEYYWKLIQNKKHRFNYAGFVRTLEKHGYKVPSFKTGERRKTR